MNGPQHKFDFVKHSKSIISELSRIRKQTFKDTLLKLIDALIAFFSRINSTGKYHLKLHHFETVWEELVRQFLCRHFKGLTDGKIILSSKAINKVIFSKTAFCPNKAKPSQFFAPDCYAEIEDTQMIFDAKYYSASESLMYKELVYAILLKDKRKALGGPIIHKETVCSVVLPSESRHTKEHFIMDPLFSDYLKETKIYEEYLSIKEVINDYIF